MKSVVIISLIILLAVGIGLFQNSRLAELEAEAIVKAGSVLASEHRGPKSQAASSIGIPMSTAEAPTEERLAQLESILVRSLELILKARGGDRLSAAEQAEAGEVQTLWFNTFSGLDSKTVFALIERLKGRADVPEILRETAAEAFVEILMDCDPRVALDLIQMLPGFPNHENAMSNAFRRWAAESPQVAIKWFKKRNP